MASSDSSMEDASNISEIQPEAYASHPGSPTQSEDSVTCQWEDCGKVFTHLPTLIHHIHNDHIGVHKSNYTCEWTTCGRRGLPQTSRFALISHIRSHTGEKPFVCALPECDKSFTRSDALAKHMRLQHNISPPAPGRGGGSRKRGTNGRQKRQLRQNTLLPHNTPSSDMGEEEDGYTSSSSDTLPPHLQSLIDDKTGLVLGRSPAMVMYLLMKAKHHCAHEQNELLLEQLKAVKVELKKEKDEKEASLDQFFQVMLKEDAQLLLSEQEQLIGDSSEVTHGSSQLPLGIPVDDMGDTLKSSWVK